jgi:hypothetical protein
VRDGITEERRRRRRVRVARGEGRRVDGRVGVVVVFDAVRGRGRCRVLLLLHRMVRVHLVRLVVHWVRRRVRGVRRRVVVPRLVDVGVGGLVLVLVVWDAFWVESLARIVRLHGSDMVIRMGRQRLCLPVESRGTE